MEIENESISMGSTVHFNECNSDPALPPTDKLPISGLLALATAAFIALLTEVMPAGLLSSIASGLRVSDSFAGQFITAYAAGAFLAAIPVTSLTQGVRRRSLLLVTIAGFATVNAATALSSHYLLSIVARFLAGVFGGLLWSLLAGYAARMSPAHLSGRAIAIAASGATIAVVFGVPLSTLLGSLVGWQGAFGVMSALSLVVIGWVIAVVPDFPGQSKAERQSLVALFNIQGIRPILFLVFTFILSHNTLYIYIEPLLRPSGLSGSVGIVLFTFGLGSLAGLWLVGMLVDRRLELLALASVLFFTLAVLLLALCGNIPSAVYPTVIVWGLAVGGFATITQAALARFAGSAVDVAQAMYTTGWNTAVAVAGMLGGVLLDGPGTIVFPWVVAVVLVLALAGVLSMNRALHRRI
ncbi:MFS transporter [Sphingomonas panacis]|nr:MFS transporter [Sphingomonas panacis]